MKKVNKIGGKGSIRIKQHKRNNRFNKSKLNIKFNVSFNKLKLLLNTNIQNKDIFHKIIYKTIYPKFKELLLVKDKWKNKNIRKKYIDNLDEWVLTTFFDKYLYKIKKINVILIEKILSISGLLTIIRLYECLSFMIENDIYYNDRSYILEIEERKQIYIDIGLNPIDINLFMLFNDYFQCKRNNIDTNPSKYIQLMKHYYNDCLLNI